MINNEKKCFCVTVLKGRHSFDTSLVWKIGFEYFKEIENAPKHYIKISTLKGLFCRF